MPTVIRFGRFRFIIYPQDHRPKHVHVLAAGAEAKFDIQTGECLAVYGFSQRTVKRLSEVVLKHQSLLLEAWEKYDGEED
jgi:hypothetical protein